MTNCKTIISHAISNKALLLVEPAAHSVQFMVHMANRAAPCTIDPYFTKSMVVIVKREQTNKQTTRQINK